MPRYKIQINLLVRSGVAVLLRLAWVVAELAYRGPSLLAVVGHVC